FIYVVYKLAGYGGLITTFSLILTVGFALVYKRTLKHANNVNLAGGAVLLGALAMGPTWGVRPQVFSFLLAGVFLKILEDFQDGVRRRGVWWLVPLMALWVNLHAGFGAGIALILLFIVG